MIENSESETTFNVLAIMRGTTVDGPGFRTSVYLAGCNHHCPGCHNPQSWDAKAGTAMTADDIIAIIEEEDFDVTLSGGDPLYNPESTGFLIDKIKKNGRNVWVYTGYRWEEILNTPLLKKSIMNADVVVDSPFKENLKDPDLLFRGSSNQRLIKVKESLESGDIVTYD